MEREPVVAGMFYEANPERLRRQLEKFWPQPQPQPLPVIGALVPHAGYIYSGRTAAEVYSRISPAELYILLGPNHTGRGAEIAVSDAVNWKTPLGPVRVDLEFSRQLIEKFPAAAWDSEAHETEHSLEVQLPFLQYAFQNVNIVAIAVSTYNLKVLGEFGRILAQMIKIRGSRCVILASSDMNHFESLERTQVLDRMALAHVLKLDPVGLIETVTQKGISMCGAAPAAVMLTAAWELGARQVESVNYATSAEASGDPERVVGYAGVLVR